MNNIYTDGSYIDKNPMYHVEDSPWKAKQILRMISKNKLQLSNVCEVGCGVGEILKQLQDNLSTDIHFHGYEISPQAYELCKQRENEKLSFYCEDLLANEKAFFDAVLCIDVFEHVEDYMGFVRNLRPKAKYKIFHIPLGMSAQAVLRGKPIVESRLSVGHIHYFMKDTALMTLEDTGYKILDYFYTTPSIDKPKHFRTRVANLPRTIFSKIDMDFTVRAFGGYSLLVLAE